MSAPPGKANAGRQPGARTSNQLIAADYTVDRNLQLLCVATRTLIDIDGKLDDLVTLQQQTTDLLRRIVVNQEAER